VPAETESAASLASFAASAFGNSSAAAYSIEVRSSTSCLTKAIVAHTISHFP
jgi:hypothetical protein